MVADFFARPFDFVAEFVADHAGMVLSDVLDFCFYRFGVRDLGVVLSSAFLKRSIFRIWKSIVLASLPILGFGMLLSYWIESVMSAKFVVAILLIAYGIILIGYAKHPVRAKYHSFHEVGANEAVQFGLVQSLALFPGTSWLVSGLLGGRF